RALAIAASAAGFAGCDAPPSVPVRRHAVCSRGDGRMRILELHAPYFRTAWRREHEVLCWGVDARCDLHAPEAVVTLDEVLARLPPSWTPDLIVLGDDSRGLLVLGLEDAPCPTVMLSVDTHHHAWWHAGLAAVHDVAFTAQRDLLPAF